ncbi:MAG: hydrolase, variant 1 family protein [Acidimicrobiia bacterium]|nr:hydrolase, variant 1 family protein [Acidimicrobiia bacterium]
MTTVLFDLDGTLTNSGTAIANSYAAVCEALGLPKPSAEQVRGFIGPPLEVTWKVLAPDAVTANRAVLLYRERYAIHGPEETTVYPGVTDMLAVLADGGVRMAVATSKDEPNAALILDHFALSEHFEVVVGAARDGTRHHKVDVISEALHRLGDPSGRVAMVGDRDHDMLGARHHGLDAVGVLWGFGDRRELEEAGATWLLDTPGQLPVLLGLLG